MPTRRRWCALLRDAGLPADDAHDRLDVRSSSPRSTPSSAARRRRSSASRSTTSSASVEPVNIPGVGPDKLPELDAAAALPLERSRDDARRAPRARRGTVVGRWPQWAAPRPWDRMT